MNKKNLFLPFISLVFLGAVIYFGQKGAIPAQQPLINSGSKILGSQVTCIGENSEKYRCWESAVDEELEKNGLDGAFDAIARFYSSDQTFDCHGFSHKLGVSAYKKFAKHEDLGLTPKTSYCGFGFYHGFMETLLLTTGNPQEARDFCEYADKSLASQTTDAGGACYHGIGHGAVDGSDPTAWGDPEAMIAPGMKICTTVSETEHQLYRCITGVFNAIEILSIDDKYMLFEMQKDPFSLCHGQPENYREGCYTNMIPALMRLKKDNIEEIARIIESTIKNDDDYKIRGMVISSIFHETIRIGFNEGKSDYSDAVNLCRSLETRSHLPCIAGLSRGFMKYGEPEKEYIRTIAFCQSEKLTEVESNECFSNILSLLRIFYPSAKAESICRSVEEKYQNYCIIK